MSHEVRNPLVAIKTFAQLLPERFDDPDFRRDFNEIVVQEIDRLDLIITQINNFAHPPELDFKPLDLRAPMRRASSWCVHGPSTTVFRSKQHCRMIYPPWSATKPLWPKLLRT